MKHNERTAAQAICTFLREDVFGLAVFNLVLMFIAQVAGLILLPYELCIWVAATAGLTLGILAGCALAALIAACNVVYWKHIYTELTAR